MQQELVTVADTASAGKSLVEVRIIIIIILRTTVITTTTAATHKHTHTHTCCLTIYPIYKKCTLLLKSNLCQKVFPISIHILTQSALKLSHTLLFSCYMYAVH